MNTIKRHRRVIEHSRSGAPSREPALAGGLDLSGTVQALWEGRWLVLAACAVALVATAVFLLTATPKFEATSLVSIEAHAAPVPGMEAIEPSRSVEREVGMLRSSSELSRRVLERLDEAVPADAVPADAVSAEASGPDAPDALARARALHERMAFTATPDNLIAITASSTSPEEAMLVAKLYAQAYQEVSLEERRSRLRAARAFLEAQVGQRQSDLQTLEQRWAAYVSTQQASLQGSAERLAAEHAGLLAQRQSAQLQLQQERLQQQQLAGELARLGPNLAGAITSDLHAQIDALQGRIAALKLEAEEYYTVNPALRGRESEIPQLEEIITSIGRFEARKEELAQQLAQQTLTGAIADSGIGYATGLRQQEEASALRVRQLEMQLAGLAGRIDATEARLGGVPRQQVEMERIDRERTLAEEEYVSFVRQLQLILVAEQAEIGYVTVIREPYVPLEPVWPKPVQSLVLSGLFGLFLGGGLAFAQAAMRQRLREPGDLAEHGFRLVGVVPPIDKEARALGRGGETIEVEGRSRSAKLLPLLSPWSPASENYRLIRTNIQNGYAGKSPQAILVTSPEASDGKTITAVNLSLTMAQSGQRTLLIGADLRRPNAHKLLGAPRSPGLAELLEGAADDRAFTPEALATGIERLYFLAAGRSEAPPPELLGSVRMGEVFARLRAEYDLIVVDAPPVLVATDALLLAQLCDATIVVVTAERTSPGALEAARNMLEGVGAEVTGTVLNRFTGGHYGYGYKYEYAESV